MRVEYVTLEDCGAATGTVVVIDVLRAFTTAAHAFAAGAREIVLAGTVSEARSLRQARPDALLMGEVDGHPVPDFDLTNAPSQFDGRRLDGQTIIQRTTAGTQGVVRSVHADVLLAAGFVCAGATARSVLRHAPEEVTFVVTGARPGRDGEEDRACAEYLEELLRGREPHPAPFLERVRASDAAQLFGDPDDPVFPAADLDLATEVDRFGRAMIVRRREGLLVMEPVAA